MSDHATSPSSAADIHVLVVDDDRRLRELLGRYLNNNGFITTLAADAAEARAQIKSFAFDVIILDVMMPGETGFDLLRALRPTIDIPFLVLTARGEQEDRIAGLELGADDYMPKPFDPRELLLRLKNILKRQPSPSAPSHGRPPIRLGDYRFDPQRGTLEREGEPVHLTAAESNLLSLFAANPHVTVSRERLVQSLGGSSGSRAVDVQITRLRRKFEPDPGFPRYLQTVRGKGYVLRPD